MAEISAPNHLEVTETSSSSQLGGEAEASEAPGLPRKIVRFFGNIGHRIVDNMSFVGEVLVEFLELDKHPYHREMQDLKRQQRKKKKALQLQEEQRQAREAAEIASLEEAQQPTDNPQ
ncbi:(d)CMP kinase [Durusdinium trenchii]|uniref:(D)CMP kinase n=1 Tax=Durusdinium trenchii TaxID=1381693 RepID=A0ABP0JU85_9DINO